MSKCYICETGIQAANRYKEHIVLNSIGGRLQSDSLICQECAPHFDNIDTALSKQLNSFGLLLDIKRDRGKNPSTKATITETGEEIFIGAGGKPAPIKPTIQHSIIDGELHLSISARDRKQMKEALNGLRRKYPWINTEELLSNTVPGGYYLTSPVEQQETIGGDKAFRAICKMAMGFYLNSGGTRIYISHLIPYIKDEEPHNCVWFFYPDDFTALDGEELQVLHTLYVKADPSSGILFAHIDLFSTFKFLVLLSDQYDGEPFQRTYSFDVINNCLVEQELKIPLTKEEIVELLKNQPHPMNAINQAWLALQKAMLIKQTDDYISQLTRKVVEEKFKDIPEGAIFDQQMLVELVEDFAEKFVMFMYRQDLNRSD